MLPDDVKIRVYDRTIDLIAGTVERVLENRRIGNRIRHLAVNQGLEPAIEAALTRALQSHHGDRHDTALLATVAEQLITSVRFQRAIEEAIRRPWEVTEQTYQQLDQLVRELAGDVWLGSLTQAVRSLLTAVARELWQEPEVRELYNIYFQQRLVEIGAEQLASQRETQHLLSEIAAGRIGPGRGEYVLSEARTAKELEFRETRANRHDSGRTVNEGEQLLQRHGRRRVSGSRLVRVSEVLRSDELFQQARAVRLYDRLHRHRPALGLLHELSARDNGPILLLGEGGLGKTTTALAFTYRRLLMDRPTQFVDLSAYRTHVADEQFGTMEWASAVIPSIVSPEAEGELLVLDAVDELLSGLSHERVTAICNSWLFETATLLCCRRSFYDRTLAWTSFAQRCELIELAPWDGDTIERYALVLLTHTRVENVEAIYTEFRDLIRTNRRFNDLCSIPLRLTMLLELSDPFRFTDGTNMLKNLYDTYVLEYLRYESARVGSILSALDKAQLLEDVAWEFYDELSHGYGDERSFTIEGVSALIDRHELSARLGQGVRDDIFFRSLLRIKHADSLATSGTVTFLHKSFQEYFVARRINARILYGRDADLPEAFAVLFSPEVSEFIKEFIADINTEPRLQQLSFRQLSSAFRLTADYQSDSRMRIARQQIGYYLGNLRLQTGRDWLRAELDRETDPWVVRGVTVGLAFGGDFSVLDEYLEQMNAELATGGATPHNDVNVGFHLTFFGDQPVDVERPELDQGNRSCAKTVGGLLYQLSTETDRGSWRLNLYTLCYLVDHARADLRASSLATLQELRPTCAAVLSALHRDSVASEWPETARLTEISSRLETR